MSALLSPNRRFPLKDKGLGILEQYFKIFKEGTSLVNVDNTSSMSMLTLYESVL